ncbi:MAG: TolC family protein, partial [Calditrichaeota bacterium]
MRQLYFALGLLVLNSALFSQTQSIALKFGELADFANNHSPVIEQLNQQLNLHKNERNIALAWRNPAINFSEEGLDVNGITEKEQFFTISKQFEMPWTYVMRRRAWNTFENAAKLANHQQRTDFISEVKTGYVELQSMNGYAQQLNRFQHIINEIANIAENQTGQGSLSAFDHKLIQMALFNLQAKLLSIDKEKLQHEGEWKARLGIDQTQQLNLVSAIPFKPVELKSVAAYLNSLEDTPGIRQANTEIDFLKKMTRVESTAMVPYFDFSGGLKRYADEQDGYIFGISIPLPVFNRNTQQARKFDLQHNMHAARLSLHRNLLKNKIQGLKIQIDHSAALLSSNHALFATNEMTYDVLYNYQQGVISVTDVVNTIQVYTESLQNYY